MVVIIAVIATIIVLAAGGLLTEIGPWYRGLRKPSWQPPDWLFGPAWTVILGCAAWAGVIGWRLGDPAERHRVIVLFAINAFFHVLWSPLFFTWKRPDWALFEVVFLWLSVAALTIGLFPLSHLASALILPYLGWVSFAGYLNLTIVRLNGPFGRA